MKLLKKATKFFILLISVEVFGIHLAHFSIKYVHFNVIDNRELNLKIFL